MSASRAGEWGVKALADASINYAKFLCAPLSMDKPTEFFIMDAPIVKTYFVI